MICISAVSFGQQLPLIDQGFMLSYSNSNRHIPSASAQTPMHLVAADYKWHLNFKNRVSFKTGVSCFITGHKFKYSFSPDRGPVTSPDTKSASSVYAYLRIPLLVSFNVKRFFIDLGGAPCVRIYNNSDTYYQRGNGINKPGFTYTLEGHLGYYIPVKQRRLFVEGAIYFSEIGNNIYLPGGNYENTYTRNFQLGIGYMLGKL